MCLTRFWHASSKLENEFGAVKVTVDEGIRAQEFNAKQLEDRLVKHIEDHAKTKHEVKVVCKETDGLRARMSYHGYRLTELEIRIEQLERERRKNIMLIEGVVEDEGTSSPEIVDQLFLDLKLDFDSHVCDRVYREGKSASGTSSVAAERTGSSTRNNKPRTIVVGFMRPIEKSKVFRNLANLKGNESWNKVYFSDDYTECQRKQIRDLRALAAYAKRIGKEATVKNHYLWVDGKRYVCDKINRLGPELTLEKAKTLEVLKGEGLAFQSSHSPLSNLYPCNVNHRKEKYILSEAAIQHTKAEVSKRPEEAQSILQARDPYKVKGIGGSFKASREWERIEDTEIDEILFDKFTRNKYCRDFLLATGNKKLFEATGDHKWACGIPLSKIDTLTDKPPGENRMGKKLESIRDKIRANSKNKAP